MKYTLLLISIYLLSCKQTKENRKYEAYMLETYYTLEMSGNNFKYYAEGHGGQLNEVGQLIFTNDTIKLDRKEKPNKFIRLNDTCVMDLSFGYEYCIRETESWVTKQHILTRNKINEIHSDRLIEFPEIDIYEILEHFETSGLAGKSPSKKYYNYDTSGILVFYTLFDRSDQLQIEEIGMLITHTYYKEDYGWAAEDQDQNFIEIILKSDKIKIGHNIQVKNQISEVITELGMPIIKNDTIAIFAGQGNLICQLQLEYDVIKNIKIGKYNINTKITEDVLMELELLGTR